jgi:ABC-type glycerol-3-phosphate transport system permease component
MSIEVPVMSRDQDAGASSPQGLNQYLSPYWISYALARLALYAVLALGAFLVLIPFAWMLSASLKTIDQVFAYPPVWMPDPVRWENYREALMTDLHPFIPRYTANTLFVAFFSLLGEIVSCSLVGFGFARLRFPGRRWLFLLVLATMAIPYYVVMIPQFILYNTLGWRNSFRPLIVPRYFATNGFAIFLFRQFFLRISSELFDAARIDGCSTWGIFGRIVVPLSKPVFATLLILGFTFHWNDFLGPMLYLGRSHLHTVSIGLAFFQGIQGVQWNHLMAASTAIMAPCIVLFFFFQRLFIQGVVVTGVKG